MEASSGGMEFDWHCSGSLSLHCFYVHQLAGPLGEAGADECNGQWWNRMAVRLLIYEDGRHTIQVTESKRDKTSLECPWFFSPHITGISIRYFVLLAFPNMYILHLIS